MTNIQIGDTVRRPAQSYQDINGTVIEIDGDRARVKWPANRTWYKISDLVKVASTSTPNDNPQA